MTLYRVSRGTDPTNMKDHIDDFNDFYSARKEAIVKFGLLWKQDKGKWILIPSTEVDMDD